MRHQESALSTDRNDQNELAELRHPLVFFWWLDLLLLPIWHEASSEALPSPVLSLPLHAALILGSTALLLLVRAQASVSPAPLTSIAPLLLALGLGLELFATLVTLCLRDTFSTITDLPFYPPPLLVDTLAYGIGGLALGLVTLLGGTAWSSAHAGQASEAMLALLLAYATTRLLLSLCLALPLDPPALAYLVLAAVPLGLAIGRVIHRLRHRRRNDPTARTAATVGAEPAP